MIYSFYTTLRWIPMILRFFITLAQDSILFLLNAMPFPGGSDNHKGRPPGMDSLFEH